MQVTAPVRVCDCGGWTDTWFAGHGAVLHVAVQPGVEVTVVSRPADTHGPAVTVGLANFGETYTFDPASLPGRHRLLEAAVAEWPPVAGEALDISVRSDMPPGASTGTSAAVAVALVKALAAIRGRQLTAPEAARLAHHLETERLGLQSGIQDQIAAAYGGINFVEMAAYPEAEITRVAIEEPVRVALEERLVLIYLGRAHRSSDVHDAVIRSLEQGGHAARALEDLRRAAGLARDGLVNGDLPAFGRAMTFNTEAQARLNPALVGAEAHAIGAFAVDRGAWGWKVNGAGGDGGSVTLLLGAAPQETRAATIALVGSRLPGARLVPIRLAAEGATTGPPVV